MQNISAIQYGLVKISGIDAKKLLQGQLTCDLENLATTPPQLAAHCTPQGRIISLFHLFYNEQAYYLLMPRNMVSIASAALQKYLVFYKATLSDASLEITPTFPLADLVHLHDKLIHSGIPTLYPETSGKFLPHELNLHLSNAISFNKGCYTGQEIIARIHYRGKLKTHLYKATISTNMSPLPGTNLVVRDQATWRICGNVIDVFREPTIEPRYALLILCDEKVTSQEQLFIEKNEQDDIMVKNES